MSWSFIKGFILGAGTLFIATLLWNIVLRLDRIEAFLARVTGGA